MLLFGGVTLHPTSPCNHTINGWIFFRNKKTTNLLHSQWSSSRRRSQQKHPTLLRGQSSNFGFFLLVFSWWHFCGVSFLRCFLFKPIFLFVPSTHLIDSLLSSLFGWNQLVKKNPFQAVVLGVKGMRFWPTGWFPRENKGSHFPSKKLPFGVPGRVFGRYTFHYINWLVHFPFQYTRLPKNPILL